MSHVVRSLLLGLLIGCLPTLAAAEEATARVTYMTGSSVYLDAGTAEGLRPAMRLQLLRGDAAIATIEVKDVSTHRAVCTVVDATATPAVGDSVRFTPAPTAPTAAQPEKQRRKRTTRARELGIRGRVGLRYLIVEDRGRPDAGYSQPALDLRIDGAAVAGGKWGFAVDARSRRTYRNDPTVADDNRTRLYRFSVSRGRPEDAWAFSLGRQYSPRVAAVSVFDGIAAEYRGKAWSVGLISGTQPDPLDHGFSSDIRDHGVYFRFHGERTPKRRWEVVTGLIGSYADGGVNREFLYLQGRYRGPKLWTHAAVQIDYNRDWKTDEAGESTLSPTSSFVTVGYQATREISLRAGFDNRRNVRLFRDRVTPITDFDDEFRRGAWAGAWFRFLRRFQVSLDARVNGGDSAGSSNAYSATFGANGFTSWNLGGHVRTTNYSNEQVEGWLYALDFGADLGQRVRFEIQAGRRDDTNLRTIPLTDTVDWYGFDLDIALGRHWYILLEAERTDGAVDQVNQYYSTASYRF